MLKLTDWPIFRKKSVILQAKLKITALIISVKCPQRKEFFLLPKKCRHTWN